MSYNIFIISDTHFGHENCYSFYNYDGTKMRPWDSAEEADEIMIERWNSVVRPNDKVYHLGDVVFNRNKGDLILPRLNGRKCLIKGNHDKFKPSWYMKYFYDVRGCHNLENFILTHIPVHHGSKGRFKGNLHGHIHANHLQDGDTWYWNCCVEVNDYTPISFDMIKNEYQNRTSSCSNFNRIKNMSLEEMHHMLYYMARGLDSCCQCPIKSKCARHNSKFYGVGPTCEETWKQWLNSEV